MTEALNPNAQYVGITEAGDHFVSNEERLQIAGGNLSKAHDFCNEREKRLAGCAMKLVTDPLLGFECDLSCPIPALRRLPAEDTADRIQYLADVRSDYPQ